MARADKKVVERQVVVLDGDDWSGLYIDGKLVYENHRILLHELAKHLGFKIINVPGEKAWESYGYQCPEALEDFKPSET